MARDLTAGVITETDAAAVRPAVFGKFFYDSGTLFLWTGVGSKVWNGNTYSGLGNLVSIGRIEESQVLKANGIQLGLNGLDSANISLALNENYSGRRVELYFAFLDSAWAVITDPYMFFAGNLDVMEIQDDPNGQARILMTAENEMVALFKANGRMYTAEDQKAYYPTDTGLDYIVSIQDADIIWKSKV